MDVVVRTPHGDADIDIVAAPDTTTLAELVHAVTGQAAPATSRVDGRAVATSRLLADLDLVIGSMIDSRPEPDTTPVDDVHAAVGLVQLTGRGAGTTVRLHAGRFRVGSARRLHADELDRAPVETSAFDIEVAPSGVRVEPGPDVEGGLGADAPTLGGRSFDRKVAWGDERLDIGGRLFELENPYRRHERRRLPAANQDGTVPFQRTVRTPPTRGRVVVDAVEDAMSLAGGLWARRRTDPGAYRAAFGFHADGRTLASVDLHRHRGVALVGSDRFTSSLARTMLIELATQHGPADLDIAIASTPGHIARWNWAKWLPHIRRAGPASAPDLFHDASGLSAWATSMVQAPTRTRHDPHSGTDPDVGAGPITLLVLDDLSLWSRRDSPVRSLLIDRPPDLRIMALCGGLHEAPGMCTSLVEEIPPLERLAHFTSVGASSPVGRSALFGSLATQHDRLADASQVVADIRPALLEMQLAADVARNLAPLDDLEAIHRLVPPRRIDAPTLSELVDLAVTAATTEPDDPARPSLDVPIGVALPLTDADPVGRDPITVNLAGPLSTILVAGDPARHDRSVTALLLGAAAQRRPDDMAILIVSHERAVWHSELAHIAGWAGRDEADDASRLIHRIAHVLTEHPELHVLIVVEHAFAKHDAVPIELVNALTELAESLPDAHLVLTGDHLDSIPEANRSRCGSLVSISADGVGRVRVDGREIAFEGVALRSCVDEAGRPAESPRLVIRPITHGRAMTPLERRLTRAIVDPSTADDNSSIVAIARRVSALTSNGQGRRSGPSLLPPPLPTAMDFTALLDRHHGDGVPVGLLDRPERAGNEAYWWQPGSGGSILAVGSARSGMTSLLDLVICGTAARFSPDDVHLYAIEALPQRRKALEVLPHTGSVATPDEPDAVRRLVDGLHRVHAERMVATADPDRPHIVLLIGDVSRLVRSLPPETGEATMQQLAAIAAAGPSVGMNVIAIASRADDIGVLARLSGDRLVGSTSDPSDRTKLGVPAVGLTDRSAGRCWSTAADRRVQLASPPPMLDAEIRRLAPEPARHRPPAPIIEGERS